MPNFTLKISQDGDLVIDADGIMQSIEGADVTAQNIRMALKAAKGDFPLAPEHGTDYEMVFGVAADQDSIKEACREAIFQEEDVEQIDRLDVDISERDARIEFRATTGAGAEVEANI